MFDFLRCMYFCFFKSSINKRKLILSFSIEILFYFIGLPFDMISKFFRTLSWIFQELEDLFYTIFLFIKKNTFGKLHILSDKEYEILKKEICKYLDVKED